MKSFSYIIQNTPNGSPSLRGRGLKFYVIRVAGGNDTVALFARAWIEIQSCGRNNIIGRVALFARAWIEIWLVYLLDRNTHVALFARAWIEINPTLKSVRLASVALFARAWIEIMYVFALTKIALCRPLCEGVD